MRENRYGKTISLLSKESFNFYKRNSRLKGKITSKEKWRKIVKDFYQRVSEAMTETEEGVLVENFGYFAVILDPKKRLNRFILPGQKRKSKPLLHTENHFYHPVFFRRFNTKRRLSCFSFDYSFFPSLRKRMFHQIMSGMRYKIKVTTLLQIYCKDEYR